MFGTGYAFTAQDYVFWNTNGVLNNAYITILENGEVLSANAIFEENNDQKIIAQSL